MPQFRCFALFNFHTSSSFSPVSYHSSGSGGSANKSWSKPACRNAVCTSIETVMWSDSGSLLLSCELAANIVFRDNVGGVGENISGFVRIDCSLSRLTLISLVRLSHDLPIVFKSFSCQLPQTFFTTVIVPISFSEFISFCLPFIISS